MDEGKMQRTIAWCICCALWLVAMFIAGWLAIRFGAANVTVAFVVGSCFLWVVGFIGMKVDDSCDKRNRERTEQ